MDSIPLPQIRLSFPETRSPEAVAGNEPFWRAVRQEYSPPAGFIHLEYGWYHPCTNAVLALQMEVMKAGQSRTSHYKRGEMNADREAARADLARVAGADPEEIIITRNTTESLNIAIAGLPLGRGDGIVYSDQDYPSVVQTLQQRVARDGLEPQVAKIPLNPASDEEVIASFAAVITPRTRAILITHLINHSGQVLPVRKLCALARSHNLMIVVDAAHSFAQLDFTLRDLDCDYFAASLHKWLGAPLGTGLLYVRRDRIPDTAPFFADTQAPRSDIRKLEHFGNNPDCAYIGLRAAIQWHEFLGTTVKEARLRFLQRRWTQPARNLPHLQVLTPEPLERHGALGVFCVKGMTPESVAKTLMDHHGIFVNAVIHPLIQGVRVTPGLLTTREEIDRLTAALTEIQSRI